MNSNVNESTKISAMRAQQAEYYLRQARKLLSCLPKKGVSKRRMEWFEKVANAHVYSYFKSLLIHASLRTCETGKDGSKHYHDFSWAGYELAHHLHQYVEIDALEELIGYLESGGGYEDPPIRMSDWLKHYMYNCFKLIPQKHERIFIRGFVECLYDEIYS